MIFLILIVVCISINACLSAFEMGLVSIKQGTLKLLIDGGSRRAKQVLEMRENLEATLSTIQVGITIVAIVSGAMASELTEQYGSPFLMFVGVPESWAGLISTGFFVVLITFISVVFGELVPKSLATKYPSNITFFFVDIISTLTQVFLPVVSIFERTTLKVLKLTQKLGLNAGRQDLKEADDAFAIHKLGKKHQEYVINLVKMQDTPLARVLLPWEQVTKINEKMDSSEVMEVLVKSGHTRVPVLNGDKIDGVLNAKEFLSSNQEEWTKLVRPILKVSENRKPLNILRMLQSQKNHMCVVVSSSSEDPIGIITIEDILEEIVGDIFDEDDIKNRGK